MGPRKEDMVSTVPNEERERDAKIEYDLAVGDSVGGGTEDGPSRVYEARNAGRIKAYDTLTGEASWINNTPDNRRQAMAKVRADGTPVLTFIKEKAPTPVRGALKCVLHVDDIQRLRWDGMGLPTCTKSNLRSEYDVEKHAEKAHKRAYAAIVKAKGDEEKEEERAYRRAQMRAFTKMAGDMTPDLNAVRKAREGEESVVSPDAAPLYVSNKPVKTKRPRGRPRKDGQ